MSDELVTFTLNTLALTCLLDECQLVSEVNCWLCSSNTFMCHVMDQQLGDWLVVCCRLSLSDLPLIYWCHLISHPTTIATELITYMGTVQLMRVIIWEIGTLTGIIF